MRPVILWLLALCLALPAGVSYASEGAVVVIGGGARPSAVLSRFITLAGGEKSRILVFAQASADPATTGTFLAKQLKDEGAPSVELIRGEGLELDRPEILEMIRRSTGVIFTGGDQARLMAAFKATQALKVLRTWHDGGGVVAGTGAGAMVLGEKMIVGDSLRHRGERGAFNHLEANNVVTQPGMGFVSGVLIDESFVIQARQSRLLSAVLEEAAPLGLGVDHATAVVIEGGDAWEVVGSGAALVYDLRKAKGVGADSEFNLRGAEISLHILLSGDRFDARKGKVRLGAVTTRNIPPPAP